MSEFILPKGKMFFEPLFDPKEFRISGETPGSKISISPSAVVEELKVDEAQINPVYVAVDLGYPTVSFEVDSFSLVNSLTKKAIQKAMAISERDLLRAFYGVQTSPFHSGGVVSSPKSDIPTFVAPERPKPAPEPAPKPESPQVVMLRKLLDDRTKVVENYKTSLDYERAFLQNLRDKAVKVEAECDHKVTCVQAAEAEVAKIVADIATLTSMTSLRDGEPPTDDLPVQTMSGST